LADAQFVSPTSSFPSQKNFFLTRLRAGLIFLSRLKHFALSGKSIPIFGNHVKPRNEKYFAGHFGKSEL
jgi:hypothetical protein